MERIEMLCQLYLSADIDDEMFRKELQGEIWLITPSELVTLATIITLTTEDD